MIVKFFFFSSRRRHTRWPRDWSSDVCSSDLTPCNDPNGNGNFRDDVRSWESLITLAIFTFYKGGSVVPLLGIIYDPVNSHSLYPFWNVDWVVTPNFIVDLSQRYFIPGQSDVQKGVF